VISGVISGMILMRMDVGTIKDEGESYDIFANLLETSAHQ
jgi:hypothetical protein